MAWLLADPYPTLEPQCTRVQLNNKINCRGPTELVQHSAYRGEFISAQGRCSSYGLAFSLAYPNGEEGWLVYFTCSLKICTAFAVTHPAPTPLPSSNFNQLIRTQSQLLIVWGSSWGMGKNAQSPGKISRYCTYAGLYHLENCNIPTKSWEIINFF